ncbi:DUF2306 domain-containing protein [Mameliella alba]|nr:DUF2306 domain-containing protein [Mameliella alba]MBY6170671.1 DUF2306 domain-containing protein [Mameliella alba]MBY6175689.1 DUF2306 domain-containing protein [Mameliella alba]
MARTWRWAFWILSLGGALVSWRFLLGGVDLTMPFMVHHLESRSIALFAHIGLAPLALALLPFQFSDRLRQGRPGLHRWLGRLYALGVLISGVAGLALAFGTKAGAMATAGFAMLAILWLGVTAQAVRLAMLRRIGEHSRWMVRSAALTLSAVTLRLYLPLLAGAFGFDTGYPMVAWLCWVPNFLVAEWMLARSFRASTA